MKQLTPNFDSTVRVLEINEKIEQLQAQIKALETEKREIVQADYRAAQDKQQAAARKYSPAKAAVLQFMIDRNACIRQGRGDRLWWSENDGAYMNGAVASLRPATFDCLLSAGFIARGESSFAYGAGSGYRYDITEAGRQALTAWNGKKDQAAPASETIKLTDKQSILLTAIIVQDGNISEYMLDRGETRVSRTLHGLKLIERKNVNGFVRLHATELGREIAARGK